MDAAQPFPGRLERERKVSRGPAQSVVSEANALLLKKNRDAFGDGNAGSRLSVTRLRRARAGKRGQR